MKLMSLNIISTGNKLRLLPLRNSYYFTLASRSCSCIELNQMAQLALHGVSFRSHSKPGKGELGYFDCEIQLDSSIIQPYQTIKGRLIFTNHQSEIICRGIRVQLEATVNLRYETKIDNRVSLHKKMESLLTGASEPGDGYYIYSPVRDQIIGIADEDDQACNETLFSLKPGSFTYYFTLKLPGETLPSAFKSQYGNLQYKIVAYLRSPICYVQAGEKAVRFKGYNNLSELPNAIEPLRHESGFQKSLFSSKKVITGVLSLEKAGFLPGEDIPFQLNLMNPKCFVVRKVTVSLIRRIAYNINGATKATVSSLDSFEIDEITRDETPGWSASLNIPRNCMPSYNVKQVYSVTHLLQYQVKVAEYPGPMKGSLEVIIGTTRESVETLMSRQMSMLQVDDQITGRIERSDSISSSLSDCSIMTLPPNYSQLSSRAESRLSIETLETLPPHYDDL